MFYGAYWDRLRWFLIGIQLIWLVSGSTTSSPPVAIKHQRSDTFQCLDGTMLPLQQRCDNHKDCENGEDEKNCNDDDYFLTAASNKSKSCQDNNNKKFTCNGKCISPSKRSDFAEDFTDGSNEGYKRINFEDECYTWFRQEKWKSTSLGWIRVKGEGNGYYLALDTSDRKHYDQAKLVVQVIKQSRPTEFSPGALHQQKHQEQQEPDVSSFHKKTLMGNMEDKTGRTKNGCLLNFIYQIEDGFNNTISVIKKVGKDVKSKRTVEKYPKDCPLRNIGFFGGRDNTVDEVGDIRSWQQCASRCHSNSECYGWTYYTSTQTKYPSYRNWCYLMDYTFANFRAPAEHDISVISGERDCYEIAKGNLANWETASIYLTTDESFELILQARVGVSRNKGLVAIDNVTFSEGCKLDMQPCQTGESSCGDNRCLSSECVCNSKSDCKNKIDEESCTTCTCDFEGKDPFEKCDESGDGVCCGWRNEKMSRKWIKWKIGESSDMPSENGPAYDHTFHNKSGHFLYADPKNSGAKERDPNPKGRLVRSNLYSGTHFSSYHCSLFFWLQMYAVWEEDAASDGVKRKKAKKDGTDVFLKVYYITPCGNTTKNTTILQLIKDRKEWTAVTMRLPPCPRNFSIAIEVEAYWQSHTILAIDDLKFNCQDPPPPRACDVNEFQCTITKQCIPIDALCDLDNNCCDGSDENSTMCADYVRMDFENGFKDKNLRWNQLENQDYDNIDFIREQGNGAPVPSYISAPTPQLPPFWDHTFQEEHGHYITIYAARHLINETASLASPTIHPTAITSNCSVRFWYFMSGPGMGSLKVFISQEYGRPLGDPILMLSGVEGSEWKKGSVLLNSSKDFQVIFAASVGDCSFGTVGKMSLDDISFTPGCQLFDGTLPGQPTKIKTHNNRCEKNKFRCANGTCIERYYVCDFHQDCVGYRNESDESPSLCGHPKEFEHGLDPWTVPPAGQCHLDNAAAQCMFFSIATNGTDSFAFYNSTKVCGITTAVLESPWYHDSYSSCQLELWYRMDMQINSTSPLFSVSLMTLDDEMTNVHTSLYSLRNERVLTWKQVKITIGRRRMPFKIRFSAVSDPRMYGYVHLNRINFTNCSLANDCRNDSFKCDNGQCIDPSRKCNLVDDCGDLSDESSKRECSEYFGCNFEGADEKTRWCGFYMEMSNDSKSFNWTMKTGPTPSAGTGPEHDHSLMTLAGHYLYIEASTPAPRLLEDNRDVQRPKGSKARLVSIPLQADAKKGCQMMFYYHMYGTGIGRLLINVLLKGGKRKHVATFNGSVFRWREGVVNLSKQQDVFNVEFVGEVGSSEKSDIAIDDILFEPGCKQVREPKLKFPKITQCNVDQYWLCSKTGNCVPKDSRCNKSIECKDGTDEDGCGGNPQPIHNPVDNPIIIVLLSSTLVVLLVAIAAIIVVMKRRTAEKFHLFSIFYDPNAPPATDAKIVRQVSDLSMGSVASNATCGSSSSDKEVKSVVNYGFHGSTPHLYQEPSKAPSPVYQEPFYISSSEIRK